MRLRRKVWFAVFASRHLMSHIAKLYIYVGNRNMKVYLIHVQYNRVLFKCHNNIAKDYYPIRTQTADVFQHHDCNFTKHIPYVESCEKYFARHPENLLFQYNTTFPPQFTGISYIIHPQKLRNPER